MCKPGSDWFRKTPWRATLRQYRWRHPSEGWVNGAFDVLLPAPLGAGFHNFTVYAVNASPVIRVASDPAAESFLIDLTTAPTPVIVSPQEAATVIGARAVFEGTGGPYTTIVLR